MLRFSLITAIMFASATAASAQPIIQPTGKWIVNFADARCVASRNYGTEEDPLHLLLKEPAHRSVIQMQIIREGSNDDDQAKASVQFGENTPFETTMLSFHSDANDAQVYQVNIPIEMFAQASNARSLHVKSEWMDKRLALSSLGPLMTMMEKCVADLRDAWNIVGTVRPVGSPVPQEEDSNPRLRARAHGNLRQYFSSDSYPWMALITSQGGAVRLSLLIDKHGRVADCSIIETSGIASLDAQSCAILKEKAWFKPAIGLDGKPARDSTVERIVWMVR